MPQREILGFRDGDLPAQFAKWDEYLSTHHRAWGSKILAFDCDQIISRVPYEESDGTLFAEAWNFKPVCLVEYKNEQALKNDRSKYRAQLATMVWLADGRNIPAFLC